MYAVNQREYYPLTCEDSRCMLIHGYKEEVEYPQEDAFKLLKKRFITCSSQAEGLEKSTTCARAVSGKQNFKTTLIEFKKYSVLVFIASNTFGVKVNILSREILIPIISGRFHFDSLTMQAIA